MSKVNESNETRVWAAIQANARRTNYYVVSFGSHKISDCNRFDLEVCGWLMHEKMSNVHEWAERYTYVSVPWKLESFKMQMLHGRQTANIIPYSTNEPTIFSPFSF